MSAGVYNLDLHCHSLFSADGVSHPEGLVKMARKNGLDGFAITDHNTCQAVDYYLEKGLMRKDGFPVNGLLIIPGVEVTTEEGHLLCIGATLPEDKKCLRGYPAKEVCRAIHEAGGVAIPPHPFDIFRAGIGRPVLDELDIDAVEVFNAATTLRRHNRKAFEYGKSRGLPMIASSDSHHELALGIACTIFELDEFSVNGVLHAIRTGKMRLKQSYLPVRQKFRKTWNNWCRIIKKRKL